MHKHDNINTSLMLFCPFKVIDLHYQGHTDEPIGSSFPGFIAYVVTPEKFCDILNYYYRVVRSTVLHFNGLCNKITQHTNT